MDIHINKEQEIAIQKAISSGLIQKEGRKLVGWFFCI
jgi:hypothetical protein